MSPFTFFRRIKNRWFILATWSLVVTVAITTLYIMQPRQMRQLDDKAYDILLTMHSGGTPSPVPIIIDIDEASLAQYGQWPWSRLLLAKLLQNLVQGGTAAVGLDLLLAEPDNRSPDHVIREIKENTGLEVDVSGLPKALSNYDTLFANSLQGAPVVLGAYAKFSATNEEGTVFPPGVNYALLEKPNATDFRTRLLTATGGTFPLPVMWEKARVGLINMAPGQSGVVRDLPLLTMLEDKLYASLGLRTLMMALGKNTLLLGVGDGLESLRIGPYTIPVQADGRANIPFRGGSRTYPYISAADVLQGTYPKEALQGKIAFVGTSAPGLLDIRATPLDTIYPGVEVHAAFIDAVLSGRSIIAPLWVPGAQVLLIVVYGLLAATAFCLARPRLFIPVGLALTFFSLYGAHALFAKGIFISPVYTLLTIITQGGVLLTLRFWYEERQKVLLRATFSRYVSPEVVKQIMHFEGDLMAGEERELSIMFTDIRRFTSIAEGLTPQQTVQFLNRYFTHMTSIVRDHSGTLDKFIGDALMAFWNAPLTVPNHPMLAVQTGMNMLEQMPILNKQIEAEFGLNVAMGIGIHTGKAYVGNMGSSDLQNYTLIGDAVNLTSRLEALCSVYGTAIIVSGETRRACHDLFGFQHLDTLTVKGKSLAVDVFTVISLEEMNKREKELQKWEQARELYTQGNFSQASVLVGALRQAHPDLPLYGLYANRLQQLLLAPPKDWNGVWVMHTK